MTPATKTLAAIENAIASDQGAKYRGLLRHTMPTAEDAYSEDEAPFRAHLGASIIGRECAREVWYSFNWATLKKFEPRMLRLFNRGHLEEPRMVALLMMIGCTVYQFDENGKQFRISGYKGHHGGSLDAVVVGCPDAPDIPILGEFKTYNDKQFAKLKEGGVMAAHWEHFIQMQQYMGKKQLRGALYMATNKNTDELHAELIGFDQQQYDRYEKRVIQIVDARTPPPKINQSPGFWKCKWCDQSPVCHSGAIPNRNCRTCKYSLPVDGGAWHCGLSPADKRGPLSFDLQLTGCDDYEMNPSIHSK